jgi:hypothetical protein
VRRLGGCVDHRPLRALALARSLAVGSACAWAKRGRGGGRGRRRSQHPSLLLLRCRYGQDLEAEPLVREGAQLEPDTGITTSMRRTLSITRQRSGRTSAAPPSGGWAWRWWRGRGAGWVHRQQGGAGRCMRGSAALPCTLGEDCLLFPYAARVLVLGLFILLHTSPLSPPPLPLAMLPDCILHTSPPSPPLPPTPLLLLDCRPPGR